MKRKLLSGAALLIMMIMGLVMAGVASGTETTYPPTTTTTPPSDPHRVTICHDVRPGNGNTGNGYNIIEVDKDSISSLPNGHDGHAGDIIPAFPAGSTQGPPPKSWNAYPGKGDASLINETDGCVSDPVDVCPNLEGDQSEVPPGYVLVDGQCVVDPPDVCPNLEGDQEEIPEGMYKDEQGNCVPIPPDTGNIIIIKQTIPDGDSQSFRFTAPYDEEFFLSDGQSNDSGPIAPGTYAVYEFLPDGWTHTGTVCSDGEIRTRITLEAGQTVTCTVTNTKTAPVDVCPNINGNQATIPAGMIKDANGNCVTPPPVLCPDGLPPTPGEGAFDPNDDCKRPPPPTETTPTTPEPPPTTTPEPPPTTPTTPEPEPTEPEETTPEEPEVEEPTPAPEPEKPVQAPQPEPAPEEPGTLPYTGLSLGGIALLGALSVISGLWMRRRLH